MKNSAFDCNDGELKNLYKGGKSYSHKKLFVVRSIDCVQTIQKGNKC